MFQTNLDRLTHAHTPKSRCGEYVSLTSGRLHKSYSFSAYSLEKLRKQHHFAGRSLTTYFLFKLIMRACIKHSVA